MSLTLANAVKRIEALEKENEALKAELMHFKRSPYYLSYVTTLNQVNDFCRQTEVKIDINDAENKEAFNMRWKFLQELPRLLGDIDAFREKMTPQEQRQAEKLREDSMVESQAEKWRRRE